MPSASGCPKQARPAAAGWRALTPIALLGLAALLAACQSAPRIGAETRAQVLEVVRDRHQLRDGHPELYAALRAGVTRRELEDGRLLQGECALPDPSQPQGLRWHTLTTVAPAGLRLARGSLVTVEDAQGAWPSPSKEPPPRLHGRFLGSAPAAPSPTLCQAMGQRPGQWQMALRGPVPAWAYDFAQPALARLDALRQDELDAGHVLRVACQLKELDGGDWYAPVWIARSPPGLRLQPGERVSLRAGALVDSKETGPLAEVLGRLAAPAAGTGHGAHATVLCR